MENIGPATQLVSLVGAFAGTSTAVLGFVIMLRNHLKK